MSTCGIDHDKMEDLHDELKELFERYDVISAVVSLHTPDFMASSWFPGCGPDCDSPRMCKAVNFRKAARKLVEAAEDIEREERFPQTDRDTTDLLN